MGPGHGPWQWLDSQGSAGRSERISWLLGGENVAEKKRSWRTMALRPVFFFLSFPSKLLLLSDYILPSWFPIQLNSLNFIPLPLRSIQTWTALLTSHLKSFCCFSVLLWTQIHHCLLKRQKLKENREMKIQFCSQRKDNIDWINEGNKRDEWGIM